MLLANVLAFYSAFIIFENLPTSHVARALPGGAGAPKEVLYDPNFAERELSYLNKLRDLLAQKKLDKGKTAVTKEMELFHKGLVYTEHGDKNSLTDAAGQPSTTKIILVVVMPVHKSSQIATAQKESENFPPQLTVPLSTKGKSLYTLESINPKKSSPFFGNVRPTEAFHKSHKTKATVYSLSSLNATAEGFLSTYEIKPENHIQPVQISSTKLASSSDYLLGSLNGSATIGSISSYKPVQDTGQESFNPFVEPEETSEGKATTTFDYSYIMYLASANLSTESAAEMGQEDLDSIGKVTEPYPPIKIGQSTDYPVTSTFSIGKTEQGTTQDKGLLSLSYSSHFPLLKPTPAAQLHKTGPTESFPTLFSEPCVTTPLLPGAQFSKAKSQEMLPALPSEPFQATTLPAIQLFKTKPHEMFSTRHNESFPATLTTEQPLYTLYLNSSRQMALLSMLFSSTASHYYVSNYERDFIDDFPKEFSNFAASPPLSMTNLE